MKHFLVAILIVMFIPTAYSQACSPDHTATFNRFVNRLLAEEQYNGDGYYIDHERGEFPRIRRWEGYFTFRPRLNEISVGSIRCNGVECDQTEERWRMSKGCLFVDGVQVRITRISNNSLNFEFVSGDINSRSRFALRGRKLDFERTVLKPTGTNITVFSGLGM